MKKLPTSIVLMIIIPTIIILATTGCGSQVRYLANLKVDTIKVVPPVISDSLDTYQKISGMDTIIISQKIVERDTLIDIRYYPKYQKLKVNIKPDTVRIIKVDTISTTQIINEDKWGPSKVSGFIILLGVILMLIIYLFKRD